MVDEPQECALLYGIVAEVVPVHLRHPLPERLCRHFRQQHLVDLRPRPIGVSQPPPGLFQYAFHHFDRVGRALQRAAANQQRVIAAILRIMHRPDRISVPARIPVVQERVLPPVKRHDGTVDHRVAQQHAVPAIRQGRQAFRIHDRQVHARMRADHLTQPPTETRPFRLYRRHDLRPFPEVRGQPARDCHLAVRAQQPPLDLSLQLSGGFDLIEKHQVPQVRVALRLQNHQMAAIGIQQGSVRVRGGDNRRSPNAVSVNAFLSPCSLLTSGPDVNVTFTPSA